MSNCGQFLGWKPRADRAGGELKTASEVEVRQEVNAPPPQGKSIGDLFPVDQYSKTSIAGQSREEAGPYPDRR